MIVYPNHSFGIHALLRVHGSAVYKCLIPALVSTVILVSIVVGFRHETPSTLKTANNNDRATTHPQAIGFFVAFYSLVVAFRLNFSYGRYWEGATAVYTMSSRWLDCAMAMSAFHYQCTVLYQHLQPPSFGNHDNTKLHNLTRERERRHEMTLEEAMRKYNGDTTGVHHHHHHVSPFFHLHNNKKRKQKHIDHQHPSSSSSISSTLLLSKKRLWQQLQPRTNNRRKRSLRKMDTEYMERYSVYQKKVLRNSIGRQDERGSRTFVRKESSIPVPDSYLQEDSERELTQKEEEESKHEDDDNEQRQQHRQHQQQQASAQSSPSPSNKTRMLYKMKGSTLLVPALHKAPIPSLFLQEMAHLVSLLSAVAMSTLRNPLEGTESPLVRYVPDKPWPPVDSDMDHGDSNSIRANYQTFYDNFLHTTTSFRFLGQRHVTIWTASLYFLLGLSRSPSQRALYNAARPFTVLGGVSDDEIDQLQMARGPSAKVALCLIWVQEFITREYLAGSAGKVAPPIVSNLYAFLSDGLCGYDAARRIAYIPFPFPQAQIEVFFSLTVLIVFPFLYASYVNSLALACVINFATVICFLGMAEVSRELENPFVNVPNDLPLLHFQAQLNEALICMYAGFHPDAWWEDTTTTNNNNNTTTTTAAPTTALAYQTSSSFSFDDDDDDDDDDN